MRKNIKTLFKNSTKERFSLRKLNIGVCSVVLGLTFVGVTTQKAYADTIAGVQEAKQVKSQSSIISSVSSKNERVELDQNQKKQEPDGKVFDDTDELIRRVSRKEKQGINQVKHVSEDNTKTKNTFVKSDDLQSIDKVANNENKKVVNNENKYEVTPKVKSLNNQSINSENNDKDKTTSDITLKNISSNKQKVTNIASTLYKRALYSALYAKNAWHKDDDGNWTYSKADGTQANEEWVVMPSGQWYYFDDDGNMAHDGWVDTLYKDDWYKYYFDHNGHYAKNAWHKDDDGNWTYSKADGKQANEEWVVVPSGNRYYFDDDGNMVHDGWVDTKSGDKWTKYYFDHNGDCAKNAWHKDDDGNWTYSKADGTQANEEWVVVPSGQWYYFDDDGNMAHDGWVDALYKDGRVDTKSGDKWTKYYFDHNGDYAKNAWHKDDDGNWTYSKADGTQANEEWVVMPSGQWYYFDDDGNMAHDGWVDTLYKDDWYKYYFDHNGHYAKNAWHKDDDGNWTYSKADGKQANEEWVVARDGQQYYFDGDTMARDGWVTTNNWSTYYFDHDGHYVKNAWHKEGDNWTYSKADGEQAGNEWVFTLDGHWYYFDSDGNMVHNGWVDTNYKDNKIKYYFDHDGHYETNTWHKDDDGNWTYSKADGKQANEEWVVVPSGNRYYFDDDGNMVHDGWVDTKSGDKWTKYYFDHDGRYAKNAWHKEGNNWTYFKADGKLANEEWLVAPDGKWYYFDRDGYMAHDGRYDTNYNGKWVKYYFDHDGHYEVNTWHNDGNEKVYFKSDGSQAFSEWVKASDGQWYYFDTYGNMDQPRGEWAKVSDGRWYYFDSDGNMAHDGVKKDIATVNGSGFTTYYFDHNGHYETNTWHYDGSEKIYFKSDGTQAKDGWAKASDGQWYYFDKYGHMAHDGVKKDIVPLSGSGFTTYYFDHDGHYEVNTWHNDGNEKVYFKSDGSQALSEWVKAVDGQWYYFDKNGHMAHDGWVDTLYKDNWYKYYFDHDGHYAKNAWHKEGNNWTYSKIDGKQADEEWLVAPDGKWYYFDRDGYMAHDGRYDTNYNGKWVKYYFDHDGHYEVNTWHNDGNEKVYFKSDGSQAFSEWVKASDGQWYYFDTYGNMDQPRGEWAKVSDGRWYYFDSDGNMAHDGVKKDIATVNGSGFTTYYFDHNGHYETNTWHYDGSEKIYFKSDGTQAKDGWAKASDGQWYYFDKYGHMAHDGVKKDIVPLSGSGFTTYYFDHDGHYEVNTWHNDGNEKVYFKSDGSQALSEWVKAVDGQWYYFDKNGHMAHDGVKKDIPTINGGVVNTYYFDHNGHYEVNTWHKDGNEEIYFKSDGTQANQEWVTTATGRYYFDYKGQMVHGGWVFTIPTNGPVATYYFDDNGHYEVNTWHEDDGNLRYSKANGKQADNEWVITTDGQWHYFNSFGYMAHDCYLGIALPNSDSNVPATIPAYYFDHNGNYIKIGSLPDVENRYIVEEEPNPWCHKGNHLIYKKVDGTQVTNEWIVAGDGNRYYFDNNGYCTKREKINA
ncbi:YSIRK-type signal peptide-containing protein [Lactobacillus crispatus]